MRKHGGRVRLVHFQLLHCPHCQHIATLESIQSRSDEPESVKLTIPEDSRNINNNFEHSFVCQAMLGLLNVFECMHIYSELLCSLSIVWEWGKPGNLEMCMDWIQSFSTWSQDQCVPCFYFSQWQRRYCHCFCNTFDVKWFNGMFMNHSWGLHNLF